MASDWDEIIEKWKIEDDYTPAVAKMEEKTVAFGAKATAILAQISAGFRQASAAQHQFHTATGGGSGGGAGAIGGMLSFIPEIGPILNIAFTAVSGAVSGMVGMISSGFQFVVDLAGRVVSAVGEIASTLAKVGLAAVVAGIALVEQAIKAANEWEKLGRIMTALTGSADAAAQKIQFIKQYGLTSLVKTKDLAEASVELEAMGMNAERVIPLIGNIATAFGGGREKIMELATAMGRITTGEFGQSMRVFRRFGIGAGDLMAQGIQIGAGNHINATAEQFAAAFENIAIKKFGKIALTFRDTFAIALVDIGDKWNLLLDGFGSAWLPFLEKVLSGLTEIMQFLTDTGIMGDLGKAWSDGLEKVFNALGGMDGLRGAIFYFVAVLESLPTVIHDAFSTVMSNMPAMFDAFINAFNIVGTVITTVVNIAIYSFVLMRNVLHTTIEALKYIPGLQGLPTVGWQNLPKGINIPQIAPGTTMEGLFNSAKDKFNQNGYLDGIQSRKDELERKHQIAMNQPKDSPLDPKAFPFFNQNAELGQIARNTHKTAHNTEKALDFKKYMLGGGSLAQSGMGITPVDSVGGGGSQNIHINLHGVDSISEIVERTVLSMGQQNVSIGFSQ